MLNWKRKTRNTVGNSVDDVRSYFGGIWFSKTLGAVLLIYLIAAVFVGWYWSQEPKLFSVTTNAEATAQANQQKIVTGYTSVATVKHLMETMLDKPGGYLTNDKFPPGLWLDNIPSWEQGVLVQVRNFSRALVKDFTRAQSQSTEDTDLAAAYARFNSDPNRWMFPATEEEYRKGINFLNVYLKRLNTADGNAKFYTRADNLNNWLGDVSASLGNVSQSLSASVGRTNLVGQIEGGSENITKTPWLEIDNVFYEARGEAWALLHLFKAVEVDFADVLAKKNATESVRNIIRELEATQHTVWSPIILNGDGYGILANHSLVLANYISRANATILELRQLLSQG